ncbi:hypothetical protein ACFYRL_36175 [Streptomyces goshikiensis]|uniref:hypothetical protein n=1 Tax=Streptomyces goshikiensis TaxID=1942 RepID=UPI00368D6CB8
MVDETRGKRTRSTTVPGSRLYPAAAARVFAAAGLKKGKGGKEREVALMVSNPDGTHRWWIYGLGLLEVIEKGDPRRVRDRRGGIRGPQPVLGLSWEGRCGVGASRSR